MELFKLYSRKKTNFFCLIKLPFIKAICLTKWLNFEEKIYTKAIVNKAITPMGGKVLPPPPLTL